MNKTFLILLALALASVVSRAEEKLDLTYGTVAGEELKLDLAVPDGGGPLTNGFLSVTNRIETNPQSQQFIRLMIREQ